MFHVRLGLGVSDDSTYLKIILSDVCGSLRTKSQAGALLSNHARECRLALIAYLFSVAVWTR